MRSDEIGDYSAATFIGLGCAVIVTLLSAAVGWAVKFNVRPEPAAALSEPDFALIEVADGPSSSSQPLAVRLAAGGFQLPPGAAVYAAEVFVGPRGGITLVEHQAGAGASTVDFWPASTIKVLAALGALDYLQSLGFSGAARIETQAGWSAVARDLADLAIDESDNRAYDQLVQIAGVDRLNQVFLSPANGFPVTVIQQGYSGVDVRSSPPMKISEAGRTLEVPARRSVTTYACPGPASGNCSNLKELADSIERVILHDELPPAKQLRLAPTDITALAADLLNADSWIEPSVTKALGNLALTYAKPGWVGGLDCVDAGVIVDLRTGRRLVIAITTPDRGINCRDLSDIAEKVVTVLGRSPR